MDHLPNVRPGFSRGRRRRSETSGKVGPCSGKMTWIDRFLFTTINLCTVLISGNFRVFKFWRISDFGTFHEVCEFSFTLVARFNNNFREILEVANLSFKTSRILPDLQYM